MIKKLENWYLQRTQPAFNDVEGVTAIDMVGKNTAKINEIIDLVNNFTKEMETYIKEFTESTNKDYDAFKVSINQKIVDFIEVVDLKIQGQDKDILDFTNDINNKVIEQDNKIQEQDNEIAETIRYIRDNLTQFIIENVTQILKDVVADGSLDESIMNGIDGLQEQINTINTNLGDKANASDVYNKSEVDTALSSKANTSDVYNKSEVDGLLANFEGGTGEGGGVVTIDGFVIPEIVLTGSQSTYAKGTNKTENLSKLSNFINNVITNKDYGSGVYIRFTEDGTNGYNYATGIYTIGEISNSKTSNTYFLYKTIPYFKVVNGSYTMTPHSIGICIDGSLTNNTFVASSSYVLDNIGNYLVDKDIYGGDKSLEYNLSISKVPSNQYHLTNKTYVDNLVSGKANASSVYTKTEIDAKPQILSGTSDPTHLSIGKDGDVYFQYAE